MALRQDHVEAVVDPFASPEEQEQQRMRAQRLAERLSVREELAMQQREKRLKWGRHPLWMALKRTVVFVFVAFVTSTFWQFFAERSGVEEVSPGFWLAKAAHLSESLFDTLGRLYIRLVDLIYHLKHLRDFLYRAWDAFRELLLRLIPINELWAAASKVVLPIVDIVVSPLHFFVGFMQEVQALPNHSISVFYTASLVVGLLLWCAMKAMHTTHTLRKRRILKKQNGEQQTQLGQASKEEAEEAESRPFMQMKTFGKTWLEECKKAWTTNPFFQIAYILAFQLFFILIVYNAPGVLQLL
ncbi:hypothetical protein QOT17_010044 [Balamuthia mandrillaris]